MKCDKCSSTKECAKTRTRHTEYDSNWKLKSTTTKTMALCTKCGATSDLPPVYVKIDCSYSLDFMKNISSDYQEGIEIIAQAMADELDKEILEMIKEKL
jgi:hypothetical protein